MHSSGTVGKGLAPVSASDNSSFVAHGKSQKNASALCQRLELSKEQTVRKTQRCLWGEAVQSNARTTDAHRVGRLCHPLRAFQDKIYPIPVAGSSARSTGQHGAKRRHWEGPRRWEPRNVGECQALPKWEVPRLQTFFIFIPIIFHRWKEETKTTPKSLAKLIRFAACCGKRLHPVLKPAVDVNGHLVIKNARSLDERTLDWAHFIIHKPASFEEPVSETRCHYRFALRCYRVRGCTAAGRSGCSVGKAKKSSHPWHFRCWSPRRNELECTSLNTGTAPFFAWCNYRDAIIVRAETIIPNTCIQGFPQVGLNLRAERVNLRAEVKWPQATSSPEGRAR